MRHLNRRASPSTKSEGVRVNKAFINHWDVHAELGREHSLFVSQSRYLYCLKDGTLKYQRKPIDPRVPGKALLMRLVLLDSDSGILYGEYHGQAEVDLLGFIARAASNSFSHTWEQAWMQVPPLAPQIMAQINDRYIPPGGWRRGVFRRGREGLPGAGGPHESGNVIGEEND